MKIHKYKIICFIVKQSMDLWQFRSFDQYLSGLANITNWWEITITNYINNKNKKQLAMLQQPLQESIKLDDIFARFSMCIVNISLYSILKCLIIIKHNIYNDFIVSDGQDESVCQITKPRMFDGENLNRPLVFCCRSL